MSYDIHIARNPGDPEPMVCEYPHQITGGTYMLGGTHELWLNVTYNYGPHFRKVLDAEQGIRWLYGKRVRDTLPKLLEAVLQLKPDVHSDYWNATEGNARQALIKLIELGTLGPDGYWNGD